MGIKWVVIILILTTFNTWASPEIIASSELKKTLRAHAIPKYDFKVIHTYPHNSQRFTEGLVLHDDKLYESQGLYHQSKLSIMEFPTLTPIRNVTISSRYFSEGITIIENNLYLLTYREHQGFVFDKSTLKLKNHFSFKGEGWGLTSAKNELIMSNGSGILTYLSTTDFKPIKQLAVTIGEKLLSGLNELEYVQEKIYANVLPTSIIVMISSKTGQVEGWIDIESLKPTKVCHPNVCVANGIAYYPKHQSFLITGKFWPLLYEVKIRCRQKNKCPA